MGGTLRNKAVFRPLKALANDTFFINIFSYPTQWNTYYIFTFSSGKNVYIIFNIQIWNTSTEVPETLYLFGAYPFLLILCRISHMRGAHYNTWKEWPIDFTFGMWLYFLHLLFKLEDGLWEPLLLIPPPLFVKIL